MLPARRAGCGETCLSGSTEASRSNPGNHSFLCSERWPAQSNLAILSDAEMKLGDSDKPAIGGPSRTKQVQILPTGPESAARRTVQRRERGDLLCGDA